MWPGLRRAMPFSGCFDYDRGTYAEYAVASPRELALKPATVEHQDAGAVPVAGLTAWQALFEHTAGCGGTIGCWSMERAAGWDTWRCNLPHGAGRMWPRPARGRTWNLCGLSARKSSLITKPRNLKTNSRTLTSWWTWSRAKRGNDPGKR